jgi:D-alanyl-D-alanine dipeptidase
MNQRVDINLVNVTSLSEKMCEHKIQCKLVYATKENFLGRVVDGYHPAASHFFLATPKAAKALCEAQNKLNQMNLGLFVYDSYRPLRAVKDFYQWMHSPVHNAYELERKTIHYPHIEKNQLAELGYVADDVSNHCFGDTIDLTLIDLKTGQELNMGACFDYFDEISHPSALSKNIGEEAFRNRQILSDIMQAVGFIPYDKEFWHFTFSEREVDTPLDFAIVPELQESLS